jgi:hypothetical protein
MDGGRRFPEAWPACVRIELLTSSGAAPSVIIQLFPQPDPGLGGVPARGLGGELPPRLSWWAKVVLRIAGALALAALGSTSGEDG